MPPAPGLMSHGWFGWEWWRGCNGRFGWPRRCAWRWRDHWIGWHRRTSRREHGIDGSSALPGWVLTWSDEFDGPDGSAVDPTKWVHDVGGSGWGNQELEYYTDGTKNAVVMGDNLVITATTAGAIVVQLLLSFLRAMPVHERRGCSPRTGFRSSMVASRRAFRSGGTGAVARVLDAGSRHKHKAVGLPARDRHHGELGKEPSTNNAACTCRRGTSNDDDLTGTSPCRKCEVGDDFHTYAIEWSASGGSSSTSDNLTRRRRRRPQPARTWN